MMSGTANGDDFGASFVSFQAELIRTAADLSRLSADARAIGEMSISERMEERLDHLARGAFVVALVGEFKRGKSTLANALLGASIMPADVEPTTALVNRIRYGRTPSALLRMRNGETSVIAIADLKDHVTKLTDASSQRAAQIEEAQISYPTRFCLNNVELLDTPGLGDEGAMTEKTLAVLSKIDAALIVTSALAPMAETELRMLETVLRHVDPSRVFIVVNQADLVDEREHQRLLQAVQARVAKLNDAQFRYFMVSARQACLAKEAKDDRRLEGSGFRELEDGLEQFLVRDSGVARLQAANETLEGFALQLSDSAKSKLQVMEAEDTSDSERLRDLENELEALRVRSKRWFDGISKSASDEEEVLVAKAKGIESTLHQKASELMETVSFSEDDINSPTSRHSKVRGIVDAPLQVIVKNVFSDVKIRVEKWHQHQTAHLNQNCSDLARLLSEDLPGQTKHGSQALAVDIQTFNSTTLISDNLAPVSDAKDLFNVDYAPDNAGDLMNSGFGQVVTSSTLRGLLGKVGIDDSALRNSASELARKIRSSYTRHIQSSISSRLSYGIDMPKRLKTAFEQMIGGLRAKATPEIQRIEYLVNERKWALRVQREQLNAFRARAMERMSATQAASDATQTAAQTRRLKLRSLLQENTTTSEQGGGA